MACVQSALMLLIGFALLRGAAIGGLSLVSQQVVNLWFVRRRGIAAAAASLGLAAGSMVFPQLIDFLISLFGWRGAYLALAGFVALTISRSPPCYSGIARRNLVSARTPDSR
jgi:MFS family permease